MILKARKSRSKPGLREMIEEAIVDCYTEHKQHGAFLAMLEDHIECPVQACVIGEEVTVLGFEREDSDQLPPRQEDLSYQRHRVGMARALSKGKRTDRGVSGLA
jgi:hypothetical protein